MIFVKIVTRFHISDNGKHNVFNIATQNVSKYLQA